MSNKSIRVVKRKQRQVLIESSECDLKTEREAQRIMFKTVTTWIAEQREIKKRSYKRLTLVEEQAD